MPRSTHRPICSAEAWLTRVEVWREGEYHRPQGFKEHLSGEYLPRAQAREHLPASQGSW